MKRTVKRKNSENISVEFYKNFHDEQEWRYVPSATVLSEAKIERIIANPNILSLRAGIMDINNNLATEKYKSLWLETEDVPIVVNTKHGEKTVLFKCYHTTNETVLETGENEIVYFKIVFIKGTPNITFTYRTQPQLAKTIKDIVESYNTTIALLNNLFKDDDKQELSDEYTFIHDTRESFIELESFFSRLYLIEQELGLSFSPAKIGDTENDEEELEELYLLLIEKKVIRLNAKLTATESTGITMKAGYNLPEAGSKLDITFISKIEYTMYGQKISVHTANLLSNAIVKQFEENEDGSKKILYDDTDSQPMYISYMGFKTIDEAKKEMSTIMEHKERYTDALTFNEYMSSKQKI